MASFEKQQEEDDSFRHPMSLYQFFKVPEVLEH
jgi:hypothetical protein